MTNFIGLLIALLISTHSSAMITSLPSSSGIQDIRSKWCGKSLEAAPEDNSKNALLAELMRDLRSLQWVTEDAMSQSQQNKSINEETWEDVRNSLTGMKELFTLAIEQAEGALRPYIKDKYMDDQEKFLLSYKRANQAYIKLIEKLEKLIETELKKSPQEQSFDDVRDHLMTMNEFTNRAHRRF